MKRALIVAATGGFLNGFLIPDMKLLQEMGYEVHCAANGNSVSTFVPEERFASIGVTFHQIDFSSTSPVSKESLTAYKQYKELMNRYHFDFVHVHTPIPGAIVRIATRRKRKEGCVVVYTTHKSRGNVKSIDHYWIMLYLWDWIKDKQILRSDEWLQISMLDNMVLGYLRTKDLDEKTVQSGFVVLRKRYLSSFANPPRQQNKYILFS